MQLDKGRSGTSFPTFESLSLKTQKVKKKTVNQFLFARSLFCSFPGFGVYPPPPARVGEDGSGGNEKVETNDRNEF